MGKTKQTAWIISLMLIILAAWSLPAATLELPLNGKSWALWGNTRETSRLGREQTIARENYQAVEKPTELSCISCFKKTSVPL